MSSSVGSLKKLDGFLAAALVDSSSGMMLESISSSDFPIEVAAAANTDFMQAKLRAMQAIDMEDDEIEDILVSLSSQYHLLRPLKANREIFLYIALDRSRANLALSRLELKKLENSIKRV